VVSTDLKARRTRKCTCLPSEVLSHSQNSATAVGGLCARPAPGLPCGREGVTQAIPDAPPASSVTSPPATATEAVTLNASAFQIRLVEVGASALAGLKLLVAQMGIVSSASLAPEMIVLHGFAQARADVRTPVTHRRSGLALAGRLYQDWWAEGWREDLSWDEQLLT
jgi:hypothetical protein